MPEETKTALETFVGLGLPTIVRAFVILVIGLVAARLLGAGAHRLTLPRTDKQTAMLARRAVSWTLYGLIIATTLNQLGFKLGVLMGAAGVLTVAVGFASQAAASNVISGLFLVGERPFVIGDAIEVGGVTGEVLSIDLVSVKVRTFDNRLVRIPNESMLKSNIINYTHFPIRRLEVPVGIGYSEDVAAASAVILDVVDKNPLCLDEPVPQVRFMGFGDSAQDLLLWVWVDRTKFIEVSTKVRLGIKQALDEAGIDIPFPHRTLFAGAPIPVRVTTGDEPKQAAPPPRNEDAP